MDCNSASQKKETAVLYFTRSAREEAKAKTFCHSGNFAQNKAIADKLIQHTYRQIKASGLPVKIFTTDVQTGNSFGDKLAHAFQSLFNEGFENIIAVGNDCLQLSASTIKNTAHLLEENDMVAGPAVDGGIYLLGMNREVFHEKKFCALAWETGSLFDDLSQYANQAGLSIIRLGPLSDVDYEQNLRVFLKHGYSCFRDDPLVAFLLNIYDAAYNYFLEIQVEPQVSFIQSSCHYRGPPLS